MKSKFDLENVENIVQNRENAGYQYFFHFTKYFQKLLAQPQFCLKSCVPDKGLF